MEVKSIFGVKHRVKMLKNVLLVTKYEALKTFALNLRIVLKFYDRYFFLLDLRLNAHLFFLQFVIFTPKSQMDFYSVLFKHLAAD